MIEDPDNAPHVSDALSTTYGVNGLSVMNQVANFDVCQCFPEDIMHLLFEGVVPYATKQCLKVLIDEKRCLTLRELNNRLESFNYGYMNNKNKPTPIARETLNALDDAKLKQSGKLMYSLVNSKLILCIYHLKRKLILLLTHLLWNNFFFESFFLMLHHLKCGVSSAFFR